MVQLLQLVLDDDHIARAVLGHDVRGECAGGCFPLPEGQVDAQLRREQIQVVCQPAGEVLG
ncbi:MAG: hypothetical protein KAZ26_16310 [Caldilineaceae bacterium]|nr:hypothetical protein [Caldilineaceae bacterium]